MNTTLLKTILIIFCLFSFNSCKNNSDNSSLTNEQAKSIVQSKYNTKIDTICTCNINDREYIATVLNKNERINEIKLLSNFAGNWQEEKIGSAGSEDDIILTVSKISFVKIKDQDYLFYIAEDPSAYGNSGGFISFKILRIPNLKTYEIQYTGEEPYKNMAGLSDELKSNSDVLSFLEKKVAESSSIYKSTSKDLVYNIDTPENCDKKWEQQNREISNHKIQLTFYDKNLFDIYSKEASENMKIENEKYKVVSYFRATVIGYNKNTKKYFVIWSDPGLSADILNDIKFTAADKVFFGDGVSEAHIFDFSTNIIELAKY
jgi:hypothetical protein